MTTRSTKILLAAAASGLLLTAVGCSNTAEARRQAVYMNAIADGSLGAGDSLGRSLFTETGQTRMAMFRTAEAAFEVAEAKEAEGTYDQWYASFIKPGDDGYEAALAKAKGLEAEPEVPGDDQPIETETFVEVPVPTE